MSSVRNFGFLRFRIFCTEGTKTGRGGMAGGASLLGETMLLGLFTLPEELKELDRIRLAPLRAKPLSTPLDWRAAWGVGEGEGEGRGEWGGEGRGEWGGGVRDITLLSLGMRLVRT